MSSWAIELRDDRIEVFRRPRRETASDDERSVARPGGTLTLATLPGTEVAVVDPLPAR